MVKTVTRRAWICSPLNELGFASMNYYPAILPQLRGQGLSGNG